MTPIDWSAVGGTLFLIATGSVRWLIPGIKVLVQPQPANGNGNGYKAALETVNKTMGRMEGDIGGVRQAVGVVGASVGEVRVQVAGLEPRVEVALEEIARLRESVGEVPDLISKALSRIGSETTTKLGELKLDMDRRFGEVDRRFASRETPGRREADL